jgi:hypothetical protein
MLWNICHDLCRMYANARHVERNKTHTEFVEGRLKKRRRGQTAYVEVLPGQNGDGSGADQKPLVTVGRATMIEAGQKLTHRKVHAIVKGVAFSFERRRYGNTTFTWVFRWDHTTWFDAGDPWPSVLVPRKDLEKLASERPAACQ